MSEKFQKYYIIAGEASGDLHASNLLKAIKAKQPEAEFRAWGGDLMRKAGAEIVKHYKDLAFMGFLEVLAHLRTIFGNIKFCKKDILQFKPDALILVDYPGFNMRIAEFAKKAGIRVIYYISPQVWAWKQSRVKKLKRDVDDMIVILPFEKDFYKKFGIEVNYVGHPLIDAIESFKQNHKADFKAFIAENNLPDKPIIALLPGSRKQEIKIKLPLMLGAANDFSDYNFVIAGAPSQEVEFYQPFLEKSNVNIVFGKTYSLLQHSTAALVTSGTATLETAIFKVPEVVCYKGNYFSYLIAKQLIKVKFISLVNLIMDAAVVKELIQNDLTTKNIKSELLAILPEKTKRQAMLEQYNLLYEKLGGVGASAKAAEVIIL